MYIKCTSTYGIAFQRVLSSSSGVRLELYVDADNAHETNDRRSVSVGVVMYAGALVSFFSTKDAEMHYAFYYGCGVRGDGHGNSRDDFDALCLEFRFPGRDIRCTTMKEDGKGAIHLANNPMTTPNI